MSKLTTVVEDGRQTLIYSSRRGASTRSSDAEDDETGSSPSSPCAGSPSSPNASQLLAVVHLSREHLDDETLRQVQAMTQHPAVSNARVMPDCHKGNGCCVGFTCQMTPFLSPQLIGGDIGCGLSCHPIPRQMFESQDSDCGAPSTKALERFNKIMTNTVPMGNGMANVHDEPILSMGDVERWILQPATARINRFVELYVEKFGHAEDVHAVLRKHIGSSEGEKKQKKAAPSRKKRDEDGGGDSKSNGSSPATYQLDRKWLQKRLKELGMPLSFFMRDVGTLGGGNHFLEVEKRSKETTPVDDAQPGVGSASKKTGRTRPEDKAEYMLTVHTGSRKLGQYIYRFWTFSSKDRAKRPKNGDKGSNYSLFEVEAATAASSKTGEQGCSPLQKNDDDETIEFNPKLVLSFDDSIRYIVDMIVAQEYAQVNRLAILSLVLCFSDTRFGHECAIFEHHRRKLRHAANLSDSDDDEEEEEEEEKENDADEEDSESMGVVEDSGCSLDREIRGEHNASDEDDDAGQTQRGLFDAATVVNCVHNYIDFEDCVIRKGAIRCHKDERCVVALNMRDGIWLCAGTGNSNWNNSGPHGCGRILSRRKAMGTSSSNATLLTQFEREMEGIVQQCVGEGTLDERPSVYRDHQIVLSHVVGETLRVVAHFKTVISAKGS